MASVYFSIKLNGSWNSLRHFWYLLNPRSFRNNEYIFLQIPKIELFVQGELLASVENEIAHSCAVDKSDEDEVQMEVEARLNDDDEDTRESGGGIWYFAGARPTGVF